MADPDGEPGCVVEVDSGTRAGQRRGGQHRAGESGSKPTDSTLLEAARAKLVEAAKKAGIDLKQTFAKEGRLLRFKAGRYAHAKQFKRLRRVIKRQCTVLGRLARDIERKAVAVGDAVRTALGSAQTKAWRIAEQARSRKNTSGTPKLYAWHAPEVECIAMGKSSTP